MIATREGKKEFVSSLLRPVGVPVSVIPRRTETTESRRNLIWGQRDLQETATRTRIAKDDDDENSFLPLLRV